MLCAAGVDADDAPVGSIEDWSTLALIEAGRNDAGISLLEMFCSFMKAGCGTYESETLLSCVKTRWQDVLSLINLAL